MSSYIIAISDLGNTLIGVLVFCIKYGIPMIFR